MKKLNLDAKINSVKRDLWEFLKKVDLIEEKPRLAVAVSGGADSMILAILLKKWLDERQGILYSITIDHQLRTESYEEALRVQKWMNYLEIEHKIQKIDLNLHNNISKEARDKRYKTLINWCRKNKIYDLFMGHNLDDQAENFIIRSFRGSGVEGLASIKSVLYKDEVRIIRPLLKLPKDEIKILLSEYKQNWIEDPTNENEKFLRAKVRKFINSQNFLDNKLLKERLANNSMMFSMAQEAIENKIYDFIASNVKILEKKDLVNLVINLEEFLFLERYVAQKFLQKFLTMLGKKEYNARLRGINKLYDFLANEFSQGRMFINNCKITISRKENFFLIENMLAEGS